MRALRGLRQGIADAFPRGRILFRRVADLWPWTTLGMAVGTVAWVALFGFAYAKLDLILLVVGYGGAGLLAISTAIVVAAAVFVKLRLRRTTQAWSATTFETNLSAPTGFEVPALRWLPLVRVRWGWVAPPGFTVETAAVRGRLRERVTARRRGVFEGVTRRVLVEDAFGLARIALRHHQEGGIEVLPHVGALRTLPVLTSLVGGEEYPHPMGLDDGDRVEMRRYVAGDPARFIHWKAFGRTRQLMVRTPERALSRARRTVAYLVAAPHDEATAGAARAAIETHSLGEDWRFGADGVPEPTDDPAEALHKIMASSGAQGVDGSGLRRFLGAVDRGGPAALVLFAPPTVGPWVGELVALSHRRAGRIRVVIGIDAIHDPEAASRWRRFVLKPRAVAGVPRDDIEQVGRALGKARCEVVIVDRVSGRVLGDGSRGTAWPRRAA